MNDKAEKGYSFQERYCRINKVPLFISRDCHCPRCGRNIFGDGGYSLDYAWSDLITSCPFCNDSFCE